jgi:hypothetical protein
MSHLNDLVLDAYAAGETTPSAQAHLAGCAQCSDRVARIEQERTEARAHPGFERTFRRVIATPEPLRSRAFQWLAIPTAAVLATVLAVVVFRMEPPRGAEWEQEKSGNIVKGDAAKVSWVRIGSGPAEGPLRPGERIAFKLWSNARKYALLLAEDESGALIPIWPAEGKRSGELGAENPSVLRPAFEVTPGDITVYAVLSNAPLTAQQAVEVARRGPESRTSEGAIDVASVRLEPR